MSEVKSTEKSPIRILKIDPDSVGSIEVVMEFDDRPAELMRDILKEVILFDELSIDKKPVGVANYAISWRLPWALAPWLYITFDPHRVEPYPVHNMLWRLQWSEVLELTDDYSLSPLEKLGRI